LSLIIHADEDHTSVRVRESDQSLGKFARLDHLFFEIEMLPFTLDDQAHKIIAGHSHPLSHAVIETGITR
jgi:hypothetical protein